MTVSIHRDTKIRYDTDSYTIGIDNHASKCIDNDDSHFISNITPTPNNILSEAGENVIVREEDTIKWDNSDDEEKEHETIIHGCLYVLYMSCCLLSPQ